MKLTIGWNVYDNPISFWVNDVQVDAELLMDFLSKTKFKAGEGKGPYDITIHINLETTLW